MPVVVYCQEPHSYIYCIHMKLDTNQIKQTFSITASEAQQTLDIRFLSKDIGLENIDEQSDLIKKELLQIKKDHPHVLWNVYVDTATTKVHSLSDYSRNNYESLMEDPAFAKVAVHVNDITMQGKIAVFILNVFTRGKANVSIFTSEEEARMWFEK